MSSLFGGDCRFNGSILSVASIESSVSSDATMAMVPAMQKANSTDPKKYLPSLASIKYEGVTGTIAFDPKGDIKNGALTLYTYKGGKRDMLRVVR